MFPASAWAKLVDLGLHRRICDVYLSHGASQIDEAPVAATTLSGMGVEWCRALYHAGKDSGRSLPSVRWKYALLQQAERMDRLCRCEREESTRGNRACSRS